MNQASIYGAFNARWLSPEDVAETFVPTPQFQQLVQTRNSILMGPRGCGKTTLLKMLTRRAQQRWSELSAQVGGSGRPGPARPDFEAVYIPSDIRWSYELAAVATDVPSLSTVEIARVQRALVNATALAELLRTVEDFSDGQGSDATDLCKRLVDAFTPQRMVPTFGRIRTALMENASTLRSLISSGRAGAVNNFVDALPPVLTGHALDPLILCCTLFREAMGPGGSPKRWAFCFDELEIAPSWMQREVYESLRSVGAPELTILLKLTWSPILPEGVRRFEGQSQTQRDDFEAIRLWQSHAKDSAGFCKEFAARLIRHKTGTEATPQQMFGRSAFADSGASDEARGAYDRGGTAWTAMVALADRDESFRSYLHSQRIDPSDPSCSAPAVRDAVLRKVKQVVLIRETYRGASRGRSRKQPQLYVGEDVIYAMSDGNPRILAGLLNDLLDRTGGGDPQRGSNELEPVIDYGAQAGILAAASRRMAKFIELYPVGEAPKGDNSGVRLGNLVDRMANFFQDQLLGPKFYDDPVASATVDAAVGQGVRDLVELGLLLGVFISVGKSQFDVASGGLVGARIRLSHVLSPSRRLMIRNGRAAALSSIVRFGDLSFPSQQTLFEE